MNKLLLLLALHASMAHADFFPSLIGGKPADPNDFPASVYVTLGGARCSATVVGPQVLVIAAHCLGYSKDGVFRSQGATYYASCELASEYASNSTADWALCVINTPVVNIHFESLAVDGSSLAVGQSLLLTGYGCVRQGGGGGNDGIFRIGQAKITRLPIGLDNDIVTLGSVALCFGDSGGAAYRLSATGKREIVGINSRGNISDESRLVSIYTPSAKKFVESFQKEHNLQICGLAPKAEFEGCR